MFLMRYLQLWVTFPVCSRFLNVVRLKVFSVVSVCARGCYIPKMETAFFFNNKNVLNWGFPRS